MKTIKMIAITSCIFVVNVIAHADDINNSLCDRDYVGSTVGARVERGACKFLGKHWSEIGNRIAEGKYRGDGFYKRHFEVFTEKSDREIFPEDVNIFDAVSRRIEIEQIKGKLLK